MTAGADGLWAITAYFNPAGYRRRRQNFRHFRQHLGVPLVAVELAYGPDFELDASDADILLRFRGQDVMWQKERLINLALGALPPSCTKIVWLDCDVVFGAPDWGGRVASLLDEFDLVQPFSHAHFMPAAWVPGSHTPPAIEVKHAPGYLIAEGAPTATAVGFSAEVVRKLNYTPGIAWAARRALIKDHGLYDACIVGGGDGALMRAAFGFFDLTVELQMMNRARRDHYMNWAVPLHDSVGGRVSFLAGDVYHLWHGELGDRQYTRRHKDFEPFGFDPGQDVAIDANGAWRWNSDKPAMHDFVRRYFISRSEDGPV